MQANERTDCPACDRIQALTGDKTALCQRCAIEELEARQWSMKQRIKKANELRKQEQEIDLDEGESQ